MRSLIILEVEHGENTDGLQAILDAALESNRFTRHYFPHFAEIVNHTVRVDLPSCFVLDSENNDGQGTCQSHPDIHAFTDNCVGWQDA